MVRKVHTQENNLVGIEEVATIFGVSIWQARRYEAAGIIRRVDRAGAKLLFSLPDVTWAQQRWEDLKLSNTVVKAGRIIDEERRSEPFGVVVASR